MFHISVINSYFSGEVLRPGQYYDHILLCKVQWLTNLWWMLLSICTQKFTRTQTNLKALSCRWRRWLILIHLVNIQNRGQREKWFQKKILSELIFVQARVNDILSFSYHHFFSLVWPIFAQSIHICAQYLNKILNLTKFHSCFRAIVSQKAIMFQTSCRKKMYLDRKCENSNHWYNYIHCHP